MKRLTLEKIKQAALEREGECLATEYKNNKTKVWFRCGNGHEWQAQAGSVFSRWCKKCADAKRRIYELDEGFFSRDNEESFYWAGFLAADGYKSGNAKKGYAIGVELNKKDYKQIEKFKTAIKSTASIKYREREDIRFKNKSYMCYFYICSKRMFDDLERFNIITNKTYTYRMPEWLINHELVRHFMRGYIDGDGCFCIEYNNGPPYVCFSMRGTVEFLTQFNDILVRHGVTHRKEFVAKDGKKYAAFGILKCSGNGVINKMYEFLYKDSAVYLGRKRDIAFKSTEWVVYSVGKTRKSKENRLNITKEGLITARERLKTHKKMAEYYGCTPANIRWWMKRLGV